MTLAVDMSLHLDAVFVCSAAGVLAKRLASGATAAVLRVRGFQPGIFGGFGGAMADAAFDAETAAALDSAAAQWCCRCMHISPCNNDSQVRCSCQLSPGV